MSSESSREAAPTTEFDDVKPRPAWFEPQWRRWLMAGPESRPSAAELARVRSLQALPGLIRARLAVASAQAGADPARLDQALEACVEHCRRQRIRPEQLRDALLALFQPHRDEPGLDPERAQARDAIIVTATRRLATVSR